MGLKWTFSLLNVILFYMYFNCSCSKLEILQNFVVGSARRRSGPCKTSQKHLKTKPSKSPQKSSVKPAKHVKRRGLWTEESMRATLLDIQSGRMKFREASRYHIIHEIQYSCMAKQKGKIKDKWTRDYS